MSQSRPTGDDEDIKEKDADTTSSDLQAVKTMEAEDENDDDDQVLLDSRQLAEDKDEDGQVTTAEDAEKTPYPKRVFLILGTEFCERFNYYGMRAILVIYFTEWLGIAHHSAVALFHLFGMLAYFTPIVGAIIADGYLGRYRTIFYVSLIYAAGTLVLAFTAFPPRELYGPMIGLLLISLGTGGIKPCVTAFGGDQFAPDQETERDSFFSAFYFMINLGSMISTFLTPVLRADVHCFEDSCYPLAFGVPSFLMLTAIAFLVSGQNYYTYIPPTGNLIGQVVSCVGHGLSRRFEEGKQQDKNLHWLDYAKDSFEESFVDDVKSLFKVLWLFLPLPLFWALFDQQGSRWTLQAVEMDGDMGSLGEMKPDQLQVLNPLLIIILIPLFEQVIYPCLNKLHIPNRPLQRMCAGMFLCCAAFVIAGFVQLSMEALSEQDQSGLTFINAANCRVKIHSKLFSESIPASQMSPFIPANPDNFDVTAQCDPVPENSSLARLNVKTEKDKAYRIVVYQNITFDEKLSLFLYPDRRNRADEGKAAVSLINLMSSPATMTLSKTEDSSDGDSETSVSVPPYEASVFLDLDPARYQIVASLPMNESQTIAAESQVSLQSESVQTLVLVEGQDGDPQVLKFPYSFSSPDRVWMGWMFPQYFVITVGEILFSITGLSFAYSQAPMSMKSLLQAAYLLTVAFGDLIVVIVAQAQIMPSQSSEFFMFALLMAADTILFAFMAFFYKGRTLDVTANASSGYDGVAMATTSSPDYTRDNPSPIRDGNGRDDGDLVHLVSGKNSPWKTVQDMPREILPGTPLDSKF